MWMMRQQGCHRHGVKPYRVTMVAAFHRRQGHVISRSSHLRVSPHCCGLPQAVLSAIAKRSTSTSHLKRHSPNPTKPMSTVSHMKSPMNQLPETPREIARQATDVAEETAKRATVAAKNVTGAVRDVATDVTDAAKDAYKTLSSKVEEGAGRTKEYAQHAVDATRDAAHRATDTAKDMYQSAALKTEDTLATSKEYVRQNPVLVVVGALAFGAAIGCMLVMARRHPTFRERYVDEPLDSAREAILAALAPATRRLHEGFDSARDDAGKAMGRAHRFNPGRTVDSLSGQIGRIGSNLKFW